MWVFYTNVYAYKQIKLIELIESTNALTFHSNQLDIHNCSIALPKNGRGAYLFILVFDKICNWNSILNCCQFFKFNKRLILAFSIESKDIVLDEKATRLTLHLPETISPQEMLLNLTYTGKINDKMFGFYRQLFYLFILFLYVNFCASLDRPIKRMGTTQNNIWLPLSLRLISSL